MYFVLDAVGELPFHTGDFRRPVGLPSHSMLDLPGGWGGVFDPPPGQKCDPTSKSWTNVLGGCKLTPQETTQRLCSLLMHIGAVNARAIVICDIIEFVRRLIFRQTGLDNF